ncbi:MAG: hypothetical protein CMM27_10430 [Rhodospirillaceae bacterium]|nr:hypothetical protein [Rhodospirillaceae bacterium]|tara:strand:- start:359 stop:670 length:312 start_codon:yes stop_codon:yes gene_type:complete
MEDREWKDWTIEEANGTGDYENVLHDTPEDCLFDGIHSGRIDHIWSNGINAVRVSGKRKPDNFNKADYDSYKLRMIDGHNQAKKEKAKRFAEKFEAKQKELEE